MDSLRGIPVEYKLDAFNMPRTGTTLSPQNWLCRSDRNPALDTLAPISPLVHINWDNAYSPQIPDTQSYTMTSKVQFLQLQHVFRQKCKKHNPSHVQRHTLPSQLLITQFRLNTHNPSRVLQHQKQTQYSMLQIKTYSQKPISTLAILLLLHHHSTFISYKLSEGLTTLSEETTQPKHTYVTPSSSLTTNLPSLQTNQLLQLKSHNKNSGQNHSLNV